MVVSLAGIPENSNVFRFITSGKPGRCKLCNSLVDKLEAHHISYSPEIIIKLCHDCHHKVHFWPQRLTEQEQYKLLEKKLNPLTAAKMIHEKILTPVSLAKLVAPSRSAFVHAHQKLQINRIERPESDRNRLKAIEKQKSSHSLKVKNFNKASVPEKDMRSNSSSSLGSSSV